MTDPLTAAAEPSARGVADAIQAPPLDLPDDPAAYIAWLRNKPAPRPAQRPRAAPVYLDRSQIPRKWRKAALGAAQPRPAAPGEPPPGYAAAAAVLGALPDLGGAAIQAARTEAGPDATYVDLVLHAAAQITDTGGQPRTPADQPGTEPDTTKLNKAERAGQQAPACLTCGTALDPDNTCLTCEGGAIA